ncbi:MAG: TrkA family potassium uptake protein [Actinomycetaceae bacterium]|nr:TrkA family potassium uptake protein [Actinomycetaceae bacterium]
MGAGRVGTTLATILDQNGHSVALIDQNPDAFRRLPSNFSGRRVTGLGFDRDTLRQAGIEDAYAFAAVSNGDNSNIISARVVRETFKVDRVVARIYDPSRADVYEKLGIPTVATVRRTTEAVLSWMMPPDADTVWTHATGDVSLVKARPVESWYGLTIDMVEKLVGRRVAFISRQGHMDTAAPDMVLQENDELYFGITGKSGMEIREILTRDPAVEE